MDKELKDRLDVMDSRFDAVESRFDAMDSRFDAMDSRFGTMDSRFDAMEARFGAMESGFAAMESRLVSVFASEIGTLHSQIAKTEERLLGRIEAVEARQRHDAGLTSTLMELLLKQTRGHEQTDNAVADMAARQSEFSRRLDEQRGKQ